ncbi:MAG: hypothetical protein NZ572_01870 [Thermoflexus sp.]|nr:hypothetical protein [Thermoflexus sp.]
MFAVELISGLIGFGFFLLLWVILPHRLHRPQHQVVSAKGVAVEETTGTIAGEPPSRPVHPRKRAGVSLRLRPVASHEHRNGVWGMLEGEWNGREIALPVGREQVRLNGTFQERYVATVGGLRCQHTTPYGLKEMVEEALEGLAYAGELPIYGFCFSGPAGLRMAPVYRFHEWQVVEPEGPILSAKELGVLRQRLADLWGCPAEAVRIYRFSQAMSWVPPVAVLTDFKGLLWLPVFSEKESLICPDGLEEHRLSVTSNSIWEALLAGLDPWIREGCRIDMTEPLIREIRGCAHESPYQLRGVIAQNGRLQPMTWPIYLNQGQWFVVLDGNGESARGVMASDRESLRELAGCLLVQEGHLKDPMALRIMQKA